MLPHHLFKSRAWWCEIQAKTCIDNRVYMKPNCHTLKIVLHPAKYQKSSTFTPQSLKNITTSNHSHWFSKDSSLILESFHGYHMQQPKILHIILTTRVLRFPSTLNPAPCPLPPVTTHTKIERAPSFSMLCISLYQALIWQYLFIIYKCITRLSTAECLFLWFKYFSLILLFFISFAILNQEMFFSISNQLHVEDDQMMRNPEKFQIFSWFHVVMATVLCSHNHESRYHLSWMTPQDLIQQWHLSAYFEVFAYMHIDLIWMSWYMINGSRCLTEGAYKNIHTI